MSEKAKLPGKTPLPGTPDLGWYDWIVCNISGGKDSQAMLDVTVKRALEAGVPMDRIVVVFADLGKDDEWEGTEELAAEHAAHYGLRFEVVWYVNALGQRLSLSERIEAHGKFPGFGTRFCTADMKRTPVRKLFTRLCRESRAAGIEGRRVRILNVMGLRAEESPKRAKMDSFSRDNDASNLTVKEIHEWLPIHDRTESQVWFQIKLAGTTVHPVYAKGMPRLSCRFCPLAGKSYLVRAAQLDPEGAWKRALMEERMGHRIKEDENVGMLDILELAQTTEVTVTIGAY